MTAARSVTHFAAAPQGPWRVTSQETVVGPPLGPIERLLVFEAGLAARTAGDWPLRGVVSHARYVTRREREALESRQPPLGRPEATCAALIPLGKSAAWWALAQDERRAILEDRSGHIVTGLRYLPAVARRLYHGRDLGEPFDFLTWFEYAPADAPRFDELLAALRRSEEWAYVEREIEIRLVRSP